MIVTSSIILILMSIWNFSFYIESTNEIIEIIPTIEMLKDVIIDKDLLIAKYESEILNLTMKCTNLEENLKLTQHSLNMANEALNNFENQNHFDNDSDYE